MAAESDEEMPPSPPTVSDVIRNLLSPSTLPHVILLGLAGIGLYLISASDSGTLLAFGVAGYVGLTIGYALTAWMQEMKVIHRFSHFQPIPKDRSFFERIILYCVRIVSSWISPLLLGSIPFAIIAIFLTSDSGKEQVIYWAMSLAGLFVVWSFAQGRALANSLRIVVESRAVRLASTEKKSRRFTSTTAHMVIIGVFAAITYWALVSGAKNTEEMTLLEKLGPFIFALSAVAIQALLFWYTTTRREIDSQRKDTAAFGFTWGLLVQLFVTWHLLSALRRFTDDSWGLMLIIEELILMVMTVVAAIWSLAKDTHRRGFRLFNKENAVFWGLSFGVAYSGSIAMIAVLGSKITEDLPGIGDVGLSASIGIGHLITAATMMWIHAWRIGGLANWLDSARIESEKQEDEDEKVEESMDDSDSSDDWGETGWEKPEDVVDESSTSIPGAEIEWSEGDKEVEAPEPVLEDDDDDEVELVDLD